MDGPHKKGKSDSKGEVHSPGTPAEKARPWTQEEMEAAEAYQAPGGEAEVARVITDVRVSSEELEVVLGDGTIVCLSLRDLPRLLQVPQEQLEQWSIVRGGTAIRWNTLDEELTLNTILARGL